MLLDENSNMSKNIGDRDGGRGEGTEEGIVFLYFPICRSPQFLPFIFTFLLTRNNNTAQLLRTALLVDIGLPVPAFLPHSSIPESVPLEVRLCLCGFVDIGGGCLLVVVFLAVFFFLPGISPGIMI